MFLLQLDLLPLTAALNLRIAGTTLGFWCIYNMQYIKINYRARQIQSSLPGNWVNLGWYCATCPGTTLGVGAGGTLHIHKGFLASC